MNLQKVSQTVDMKKSNWLHFALILLIAEKVVQHIFVTLAFYFNWKDIASTVVTSPNSLIISGAFVAIGFMVGFWGMIKKQVWSIKLIIFLAAFDIIGEFVAQGKIDITITVSFIVAILLLILAWIYHQPSRLIQH